MLIRIQKIPLDSIRIYISETKKEGMAGFSENAEYFGLFTDNILAGFTSIQQYGINKVKFNNHYILKEYRGRGYFKLLFSFSKEYAKGRKIIATCTEMSLQHYLSNGAKITKQYKHYTSVEI